MLTRPQSLARLRSEEAPSELVHLTRNPDVRKTGLRAGQGDLGDIGVFAVPPDNLYAAIRTRIDPFSLKKDTLALVLFKPVGRVYSPDHSFQFGDRFKEYVVGDEGVKKGDVVVPPSHIRKVAHFSGKGIARLFNRPSIDFDSALQFADRVEM